MSETKLRYISLFAGVGGFDLALTRLGHKCVYANDFDKYCKTTYDKNFHNRGFLPNENKVIHKDLSNTQKRQDGIKSYDFTKYGLDSRSITEVTTEEIPDHDLLVGGFPCQSFSIAGKRGGFTDTRGTMFFEIARILQAKQPRLFILENVKGLLSHDSGSTFKTIIATLAELGYDLQWQVVNSKNFGVPQNRERVFIVGNLRGTSRPKIFPIGEDDQIPDRESQTEQRRPQAEIYTTLKSSGAMKADDTFIKETQKLSDALRVRSTGGLSVTLKGEGGGMGAKTGLYAMRGRENGQELEYRGNETNTLTSVSKDNLYLENMRIRRLTPTECERLQGFPDGWTEGVSDTQRYKQMGNAVTVNVVYEIAKRL